MEQITPFDTSRYSAERAAIAARRVFLFSGKWPHELVKDHSPHIWNVKLSEEFATLVRLSVESHKVELGNVLQRLKEITLKHPNEEPKCLNRDDISQVRAWLRTEGVDSHPRFPRRSAGGEDGNDANRVPSGAASAIRAGTAAFSDITSDSSLDFNYYSSDDEEANESSTIQIKSEDDAPFAPRPNPVTRPFSSNPSSSRASEPGPSASQPPSRPNARTGTTPSNNTAPSTPLRVSDSVNAHFQESLRRAAMTNSASRPRPQASPSRSVARPNNTSQAGPSTTPSRTTPSHQASPSLNRTSATEPRRNASSDRSQVNQSTQSTSQQQPSATINPPRLNAQASNNPVPRALNTPVTSASSSNVASSPTRAREPRSTTNLRPAPITDVPTGSALHRLDGSFDTYRHARGNASSSASLETGISSVSTPNRPDVLSNVGLTSSNSTPATARTRRDIQPPTRQTHDLPLSAVLNPDLSRKRPLEPTTQVTYQTPERPGVSSAATGTNSGSSNERPPQAGTGNATRVNTASSSQPAPTSRTQAANAIPAQTNCSWTIGNARKRQRLNDPTGRSISLDDISDFDATLPNGECFKRHLREWHAWAEPHAKNIDQKLVEIVGHIHSVSNLYQTNSAKRENAMNQIQAAKQSLEENQAVITKNRKIIAVLEEESQGDVLAQEYLDKRKGLLKEHELVHRSFQYELTSAQTILEEIDLQHPTLERKLGELVEDEATLRKKKKSLSSAIKKWEFQTDLMEADGGWAKAMGRWSAGA
ncbi:unnamed protein product [Fusarium graminearum]|uniref:Chromosome 3, complete genome n=1 Tax=Gibberella zeae (strain ATCC MYA-4620 / CBS 123657 / FGSC 9075 / NRRL 31084 / PH-1) TaxID=229533 RepID=A0A098E365_GIBZE|nr:unnamed protein product [Fusarium graminearum]